MLMPNRILKVLAICAASLCIAQNGGARADAITIKLPPETVSFKPGPGAEIANANCQICHSADYVSTQPFSTSREEWTEIVEKMQSSYGAPIQTKQIPPLVDYLVKHYGDEPTDRGADADASRNSR